MEKYAKKLKDLLIALCTSDEEYKILDKICNKVVNFTESNVEFEDFNFDYEKSKNKMANKDVPKSFGEISSIFSSLTWDGGGVELDLN